MPRPVYILAADTIVEDKRSGLLTLVNVLERVTLSGERPSDTKDSGEFVLMPSFSMMAAIVWMREAGDSDYTFEEQVVVSVPGGPQLESPMRTFKFSADETKALSRNIFKFDGPAPFTSGGSMTLTGRIRRVGETEWIKQEYSVNITDTREPVAESNAD